LVTKKIVQLGHADRTPFGDLHKRRAEIEKVPEYNEKVRYSTSLVTQGTHRFYTLTMPSDVLAGCCFATNREEDPLTGFQRVLDPKRAQEIADYMDQGFGTIPSSIVLSAQPEAEIQDVGRGKTLEFKFTPHSFLIIDGQHRVFGFSKAQTKLRVPVVIYNGLTKQQESKLFIDINTKQRPVSNELLLDIKKLADDENDDEVMLGELFDSFNSDQASPLMGMLSSSKRQTGKLSRVTFYAAVKPILGIFGNRSNSFIYPALRGYLHAFSMGLTSLGVHDSLVNPTVFRAIFEIFPEVAQRVVDRRGPSFKEEAFQEILFSLFEKTRAIKFSKPPRSHKELAIDLSKSLKAGFLIG
jgi:DGQHR domain-containing protein